MKLARRLRFFPVFFFCGNDYLNAYFVSTLRKFTLHEDVVECTLMTRIVTDRKNIAEKKAPPLCLTASNP